MSGASSVTSQGDTGSSCTRFPTKYTFIHFDDSDGESPERSVVDPFAHPRGSLTLSPALPPSRRKKAASFPQEPPSGFTLGQGRRGRGGGYGGYGAGWDPDPRGLGVAPEEEADSDEMSEIALEAGPDMLDAILDDEEMPEPGTPRREGPSTTVLVPDTPERPPTDRPDYTPERLARLPRWSPEGDSLLTSSSASASEQVQLPFPEPLQLPPLEALPQMAPLEANSSSWSAWQNQSQPAPCAPVQPSQATYALSSGLRQPEVPRLPHHQPQRPMLPPPQLQQTEWMPLSTFGGGELGGYMFKFTLRKADNTVLGLEVEREKMDRALLVKCVNKGGAVESWNKQCSEGPGFWKAVMPGDRIVQANKALGCAAILEEFKFRQLLRLVIVREVPTGNEAGQWSDSPVGGLGYEASPVAMRLAGGSPFASYPAMAAPAGHGHAGGCGCNSVGYAAAFAAPGSSPQAAATGSKPQPKAINIGLQALLQGQMMGGF